MSHEVDAIILKTVTDDQPFCSDAELAHLRHWVFNANHVRDIGRVKDGKLYCASGIGRLNPPATTMKPDVEVNGMRVFASIPLMISEGSNGFVVEEKGVSVVLNPAEYIKLDEPPMYFSGYLKVKTPGRIVLVHGFGHAMPVSEAEVLSGEPLVRDGVAYRPLCSSSVNVCVVAAEPAVAMMAGMQSETWYFQITGGLLGGLLAAVVLLRLRTHRSLEAQLRRAIRRGGIRVEYQPVVSLSTGRIVAAEALARWNDEANMPIPPNLFIAMAEEKGFVGELTRLMAARSVRELCEQMRDGSFRVTLNIAPQDLEDASFPDFLAERLREGRVPASALGLEITERSTANHGLACAAIERLKSAGHAVYIDDFGTGYSSLSYLHELAVDGIKIDQTFTQTIGTEAVTASVVPQILSIARQLQLQVVVEGIETKEQATYFEGAIGGLPVLGQGWFLGNPMPAAELKEKLRQRAVADIRGAGIGH
jgi:sensor c-di-GMP phosphodiesterase-like protein